MSVLKYIYRCSKCGRTEKVSDEKTTPVCCDKIMVKDPLDQCTIADHSEMVRSTDKGEPCDDGRGKENSDQ